MPWFQSLIKFAIISMKKIFMKNMKKTILCFLATSMFNVNGVEKLILKKPQEEPQGQVTPRHRVRHNILESGHEDREGLYGNMGSGTGGVMLRSNETLGEIQRNFKRWGGSDRVWLIGNDIYQEPYKTYYDDKIEYRAIRILWPGQEFPKDYLRDSKSMEYLRIEEEDLSQRFVPWSRLITGDLDRAVDLDRAKKVAKLIIEKPTIEKPVKYVKMTFTLIKKPIKTRPKNHVER